MIESEGTSIIESKLDLVLKVINSLSMRIYVLEDFVTKTRTIEASQPMQTTSTSATILPTQGYNSKISNTKKSWISLPENFDAS